MKVSIAASSLLILLASCQMYAPQGSKIMENSGSTGQAVSSDNTSETPQIWDTVSLEKNAITGAKPSSAVIQPAPKDNADDVQTLNFKKAGITLQIPKTWGNPKTPEYIAPLPGRIGGHWITYENCKNIYLADEQTDIHATTVGTFVLNEYPFLDIKGKSLTYGCAIPFISINTYPEDYSAIDSKTSSAANEESMQLSTDEKRAILEPLLQIYHNRKIASEVFTTPRQLRGAWWGNMGSASVKFAPQYLESKDGTFRGAGYIESVTQDVGFNPSYKVVLVNPNTHTLLLASFPIHGVSDIQAILQKFTAWMDVAYKQYGDKFTLHNKEGQDAVISYHAALEPLIPEAITATNAAVTNANTPLGMFVRDITKMAESIR